MLNRLRIGPRLLLLISVQTLVLVAVGATAVLGLRFAAQTTDQLNKNVIEQVSLNQMNELLRVELLDNVAAIRDGRASWEQGQANLLAARNLFVNDWDEYKEGKTEAEIAALGESLAAHFKGVTIAFDELIKLTKTQDKAALTVFSDTNLTPMVAPFLTDLNERMAELQLVSENLFEQTLHNNALYLAGSIAAIALGLILAGTLGFFVHRSIVRSVKTIADAVNKVAEGDYYARTTLTGPDELSRLGSAFDHLLDERVATLVQAEQENERLNDAVISLLQGVSKLSQRDLTVKIPVTEDVTGPVADALNQLTTETSRVLMGVRRVAEQVAKASSMVRTQSDMVISLATAEQEEIDKTAAALAQAAATLNHIAELAQASDLAAENAVSATDTALRTVNGTVDGINEIRGTIHETEKRIKRLGDRSQDIGRAINLINNIAERTHILALNASMHAASAGEAGRGFAVVADEVQRLAENARDATQQISTLVANIQNETNETVATMNNVITQVVAGNRMAEQAGEHMRRTQQSTSHLVDSVRQIAQHTANQILLSTELQTHAQSIQNSTRKTRSQMEEQTQQTKRLAQFAKGLLTAVQVFTLPMIAVPNSEPEATDAGSLKKKAG